MGKRARSVGPWGLSIVVAAWIAYFAWGLLPALGAIAAVGAVKAIVEHLTGRRSRTARA